MKSIDIEIKTGKGFGNERRTTWEEKKFMRRKEVKRDSYIFGDSAESKIHEMFGRVRDLSSARGLKH
jgi:hypothetical protein